MKPSETRDLSPEEIREKLRQSRQELLNLRVQATIGQLPNVRRIRSVRQDVARLETVLRQKERL
ncbi:MAG: 50S ribosomal protein L29 [Deinococcus sp.]|nr:50S ribosomal protein L29 [Deinococcus sp.]